MFSSSSGKQKQVSVSSAFYSLRVLFRGRVASSIGRFAFVLGGALSLRARPRAHPASCARGCDPEAILGDLWLRGSPRSGPVRLPGSRAPK